MLRNSHNFLKAAQLVVVGQDLTSQSRYCYLPCPAATSSQDALYAVCVCVCVPTRMHVCTSGRKMISHFSATGLLLWVCPYQEVLGMGDHPSNRRPT